MVHYIQKETVKKWLKCDDEGFDKIISETRTLLRTAENMSSLLSFCRRSSSYYETKSLPMGFYA